MLLSAENWCPARLLSFWPFLGVGFWYLKYFCGWIGGALLWTTFRVNKVNWRSSGFWIFKVGISASLWHTYVQFMQTCLGTSLVTSLVAHHHWLMTSMVHCLWHSVFQCSYSIDLILSHPGLAFFKRVISAYAIAKLNTNLPKNMQIHFKLLRQAWCGNFCIKSLSIHMSS